MVEVLYLPNQVANSLLPLRQPLLCLQPMLVELKFSLNSSRLHLYSVLLMEQFYLQHEELELLKQLALLVF